MKPTKDPLKNNRPIRRAVTLDEKTSDKLVKIGDGNMSAGIRIAAKAYRLKKVTKDEND